MVRFPDEERGGATNGCNRANVGIAMQLAHCCLVLMWALTVPNAIAAQSPVSATPAQQSSPTQKPQAGTVKINPGELPVSLDRIQRALADTPMLRFDQDDRPVFRMQVFGEKPTIEDILGPDFAKGPVKYGSMTHQEFLSLVTPKDLQGYGAFSNKEGATVAATSFLLQWTLQRAIRRLNQTQDEQERAAARKEVMDALDELEKARAKAGLPAKR
jgi:hypothetical protein